MEGFFKHILVMTDFSEDAYYATEVAAKMAKMGGCKLTIMHVAHDESQICLYFDQEKMDEIKKKIDDEVEKKFNDLIEKIPELKDIEVKKVIRRGVPYVESLLEIEKGIYDLVVMGSHGQSGIRKFFFGSTVEKVARRSPVSVLVTRREKKRKN